MRAQRERSIIDILTQEGVIRISDLTHALGVSRNTVRRDLQSLEEQGIVVLRRGGAMIKHDSQSTSPTVQRAQRIESYRTRLAKEKRLIGQRAAALVPDDSAIVLDSGTTTEQIARALRHRAGLTVFTNEWRIIEQLADSPKIAAVMAGGVLDTLTQTFIGEYTEQFLRQFHVDIAFISAGGVTTAGVTNGNTNAGRIKQVMLEIASTVYVVVAHDKIGKRALAPFASLAAINGIITDTGADPDEVDRIRSAGTEVLLA